MVRAERAPRDEGRIPVCQGLRATLLEVADTTEAVRDGPADASKGHFAACLPNGRVFGRSWLSVLHDALRCQDHRG